MPRKPDKMPGYADATPKLSRPRLVPTAVALAILSALLLFMWFTVLRHDAKNLIGQALPEVPYIDLSGAPHRLNDHRDGPFLLVVVRDQCPPCQQFLSDLVNQIPPGPARERTLALFLERPESDTLESVKLKSYPFPQGFVRVLRDAAPLQVIVVPTVFLAVNGRVEAVEYGIPERLTSVVEKFLQRFQ